MNNQIMTIDEIEQLLNNIAEGMRRIDAELNALRDEVRADHARLDEIGAGLDATERLMNRCCNKKQRQINKLTAAQSELLAHIKMRRVTIHQLTPGRRRVVKALIAKGMVEERYQLPQPGNDYGGYTYYVAT